jgi:hypothetical protein
VLQKNSIRGVVMKLHIKKTILLLFIMTHTCLCAKIPETRVHIFKNYLKKATYGGGDYARRVELYKNMLPLIDKGVPGSEQFAFTNALRGLYSSRQTHNSVHLLLLKDLLKMVVKTKAMQHEWSEVQKWIQNINQDLTDFALKDGDIVTISDYKGNNQATCIKDDTQSLIIKLCSKEKGFEGPRLFKIVLKDNRGDIVYYNNSFELVPLYFSQGNSFYSLGSSKRVALMKTYNRGNMFTKLQVFPREKKIGQDGSCEFSFVKRGYNSKDPVLPCEVLSIFNKGCDLFDYCMLEKVSFKDIVSIENDHFEKSLRAANKNYFFLFKLFSERIHRKNTKLFFDSIIALFDRCDKKDFNALYTMRSIFYKALDAKQFEDKHDALRIYLSHINKYLMPFAIQSGDIIQMSSPKFKRLLWTHGESRFSDSNYKQLLVGPNSDIRTQNGPQFFRIERKDGKRGPIKYFDEVRLFSLYSGVGRMINPLGRKDFLWVNNSSRCGNKFYEILVSDCLTNQERDNRGRDVFVLKPSFMSLEKDAKEEIPVLHGDTMQWWSGLFERKIWVNTESVFGNNWYEVLVGPNDDSYKGCNRTKNGQEIFAIEKVDVATFRNIATEVFYKQLIDAESKATFVKRIDALKLLIPFLTKDILTSKRERFVLSLSKLFTARKKMKEKEVLSLKDLLHDSLDSSMYVTQKDEIKKWIEKIDTEKIENLIDQGLLKVQSSQDMLEKIVIYNNTLDLFNDPLSNGKIDLFFYSLNKFIEQKEQMNVKQLYACNGLIKKSRLVLSQFSENQKALDWKTILEEHALDIDFRARLADASGSRGAQQAEKYRAMIPFVKNQVSREQKKHCVNNLKKLLAEKTEEIKALKKVLSSI